MSDLWFIFKNGDTLGPFTAEQIRVSLRDGSFDPFDLVARDGSSVRRELVEVDELFQSSQVSFAVGGASLSDDGGGLKSIGKGKDPELVAGQGQLMLAANSQNTLSNGLPVAVRSPVAAAPSPGRPGQAPPRKKRRDPRHFHAIDGKGRMMGPITAGEIQALYYKGVLDKNVKVMRDGSKARVPVDRFVAAYSESRSMRGAQQGAHPHMPQMKGVPANVPTSALHMMAQKRRSARSFGGGLLDQFSPVSIAAVILAVVLSGLAIWIVASSGRDEYSARPETTRVDQRHTPKTQPKALKKDSSGKLPTPSTLAKQRAEAAKAARAAAREAKIREDRAIAEAKAAARDKQKLKAASDKRRASDRLAKQMKERRRVEARRATLAKTRARELDRQRERERDRERERARLRAASQRRPTAVQPVSVPKASGVAALVDGQSVTGLGPMSFDRSAVQKCEGSCTVTFSGAGGTVRVAFFKQVWGPTLLAKSGSVYVSGLVRKSGTSTKIILSNVN